MTPRLYKEAEVCAATGLQPYVLRSWEKEFPGIGVQKSQDTPRFYRESDLEQVRRIKQLVFGEGLTLAGARRRLEETTPRPVDADAAEIAEVLDTLGADARSRIDLVRIGLRSILEVLSKRAGSLAIPELPRNGSSDRRSAASGARKSASRSQKVRRASASNRNGRSSSRPKSAKRVATPKRGAAAQKRESRKRKRASA